MSAARSRRVVVTRPRAQAQVWLERLRERGLDAVALPLLEIGAAADPAVVAAAWLRLGEQALVVFVSANAVEAWFAARPAAVPGWPRGVRAAAPGPGTAAALQRFGVPATAIVAPPAEAEQQDSEALWALLRAEDWHAQKILIVRGDGGRDWLGDRLREAGAEVAALAAYRRLPPAWSAPERALLSDLLAEPERTLWLFTNSEAIDHLLRAAGADGSKHRAVVTHSRVGARAIGAGFGPVIECAPGLESVIACIQSMPP